MFRAISKMFVDRFIFKHYYLIIGVNDDGRRKTYSITTDGISALKKEYERLNNMVDDGAIIKEGPNE